MIAYKFLEAGAVGPFTGFRWPVPGASGPGGWVDSPSGAGPGCGVHACRVRDLPYWFDEELWRVELSEPVREHPTQVEADSGRLVGQIAGWGPALRAAFGAACALRARDFAVEALRAAGEAAEAESLLACGTREELRGAAGAMPALPAFPAEMVGYADEAAKFSLDDDVGCASYIAAVAAVALRGSQKAFTEERGWQASWLSAQLGLE